MPKLTILEFKAGMFKSSGFTNRKNPSELVNIELNREARPVLRKAHRPASLDAFGNGDRLSVNHYLGDRDNEPSTIAYRFPEGTSWVNTGRRFFYINDSEKQWVDLQDGSGYPWDLPKPPAPPQLDIDLDFAQVPPTGPAALYMTISDIEIVPNPFVSSTNVTLTIAGAVNFRLLVVDFQGRVVRTLHDDQDRTLTYPPISIGTLQPGTYNFHWDGRNDVGELVASQPYTIVVYDTDGNPIRIEQAANLPEVEGLTEEQTVEAFFGPVESASSPRDDGELVPGVRNWGFRGGYYNLCYTYASDEYGIETAPSSVQQIHVTAFSNINTEEDDPESGSRAPVQIEALCDTSNAPVWANRIKLYAKRAFVPPNTVVDPKELAFANGFTYVTTVRKTEDQRFQDETRIVWANEDIELPRQYMFSQEFNTEPDIAGLRNITTHAGRIWGYDRNENLIRFSLIDSRAVSNYEVFPLEDAALPHALKLDVQQQSYVQHIERIPGRGGLYVFFRDSIKTIVGQSLIQGLYSADITPGTDLDASGGIDGVGTYSPRTVIAFDNFVIFLGSDRVLYQMTGSQTIRTQNMGHGIQDYLDDATESEIQNAFAWEYLDRYYLSVGTDIFVLDTRWKYWVINRFDDQLQDVVWSQGGADNESILYGLTTNGSIIELFAQEDSGSTQWSMLSAWHPIEFGSILQYVYVYTDSEPQPISVRVDIDSIEGETRDFEFSAGNLFRMGVSSGRIKDRARVMLSGTGSVPAIRSIDFEVG